MNSEVGSGRATVDVDFDALAEVEASNIFTDLCPWVRVTLSEL